MANQRKSETKLTKFEGMAGRKISKTWGGWYTGMNTPLGENKPLLTPVQLQGRKVREAKEEKASAGTSLSAK